MQATIRQLTIRQLTETDRRCRELLDEAQRSHDLLLQSVADEQQQICETHERRAREHLLELEQNLLDLEQQALAESRQSLSARVAALDAHHQQHFEQWVFAMVEAVLEGEGPA